MLAKSQSSDLETMLRITETYLQATNAKYMTAVHVHVCTYTPQPKEHQVKHHQKHMYLLKYSERLLHGHSTLMAVDHVLSFLGEHK